VRTVDYGQVVTDAGSFLGVLIQNGDVELFAPFRVALFFTFNKDERRPALWVRIFECQLRFQIMSLIGFRREDDEIEYLEEVEYSEEHLEDDLHEVIYSDPRLVMGTLTTRENVVLGSKLQLPTGKEPDLLVCDKRGTLTTIEFKRDRSPRSAVTQLFDYASSLARLDHDEFLDLTDYESLEELYETFDREEDSEFDIDDFEREFSEGLESPQLMLVAYTISDDVRRMTRWLRDAHNLKINCVEFDYYEKDDAEMFVPTVIGVDETQEIKEKEESPKQKKYRRFFGEVLERFKEELPGVTSRSAGSDSWITIPTGHSKVEFLWHFKGDPGDKSLHVVMNFQLKENSRNKELLETMLSAIDARLLDVPEEIHSEEYGTSGYTRLYIKRDVGRVDDALDDDELKSWAVDRMAEFHEQLTPVLEEELR